MPRKKTGKPTETRMRQEFAFGFDDRFQLDIYLNTVHKVKAGNSYEDTEFGFRGWSAEIRWAFADWGVIPGNPTLYFEYLLFNGAPNKIEPKLLLGGELTSRWHWGVNIVYEREVAGKLQRDEETKFNFALSYTMHDEKFSIGPSLETSTETERFTEPDGTPVAETTTEWLFGPSIQWRLSKRATLDVEPLFGLTDESKSMKTFIVFSWSL